jgi:hypothetical protein
MPEANRAGLVAVNVGGTHFPLRSELDLRQAVRFFGLAFCGGEWDDLSPREQLCSGTCLAANPSGDRPPRRSHTNAQTW